MDRFDQQWNIVEGTDVVGVDGSKVGEVVAVHPSYIVVEKGFFFPTDYYIPTTAIASYDGDKVYLSVSKDEALNQGWDVQPTADSYLTTDTAAYAGTTGTAVDAGATDATMRDAGYVEPTANVARDDVVRVPVHEEELIATKRPREAGEVTISKDVVTEQRTVEVPITEERVRVQWRTPSGDTTGDEAAFEEGSIEIPVRTEEVDLQKRTVVTGELEVEKEQVQRTEQVSGTVRKEVVDVDESGMGTTDVVEGARVDEGYGAGRSS